MDIRVAQWAIRITLVVSVIGILVVALFPELAIEARITSVGIALQIAGIALAVPELANRLSNKPATDLIIWAETFLPFWKILSKITRRKLTLGQLSVILSVLGIILIFGGLVMQYFAAYLS
jgi:uncharacterized membrane protein HdeD (DUF308 family)